MADEILVIVEVAEKLLGIVIDIVWLLKEAGTEEVIEDLSQFWVFFQVFHMILLDVMLDIVEVSLEF